MNEPEPLPLLLGSTQRVVRSGEFTRLRNTGQRLAHGCLVLNWLRSELATKPRLGVVTSRKIGWAVLRSRARRLLREAFRRHQHDFSQPVTIVLVARNSIVGKTYGEVERDYLHVLRRARLLPAT
ncbi:MAG: ribonuclease P protein component [Verrucomicrobia bacterium]|nr:ribonuclease P protein component [Verrucomicrobiota bacterium]